MAAATTKRPATCGEWTAANASDKRAEGRMAGCRRLPNHGGECRGFLTLAAQHKAERLTSKRVTKKADSAAVAAQIMADLAADRISANEALSQMADLLATKRVTSKRVTKAQPKAAPAAADNTIRFGVKARMTNGLVGKVLRVKDGVALLRTPKGDKTVKVESLTRVVAAA